MSLLTERIQDYFELSGQVFNVNMSYDNILLLFEMFEDDAVSDEEKLFLALEMLIVEYDQIRFDSPEQIVELYKYIMREFLGYDVEKKEDEEEEKQKRSFDYTKDAELIFASFFANYKIDLVEMQGKLHWKKFNALLNHLDEDSPFKKVVGYRVAKIPKADKHNKEQVEFLRKMKRLYALDEEENSVENAFSTMSEIFKSKVKPKAGEV